MIDTAALEGALADAVASGAVPGAVAIVADRDGVLWQGAAGPIATGDDRPMRADTIFRIASMTKLATSVAVLQLVEAGRLSLDTPVAEVVPRFGRLKVLDGFDGDTPRLREPAAAATVRQLLTHTAGTGYATWNHDLMRFHKQTGAPEISSGLHDALDRPPLVDDPGRAFNYSVGHDWAGLVVEAVSGQRIDRYWQEHLFGPLAMRDTGCALGEAGLARAAPVHVHGPDGAWLPVPGIELAQDPEFYAAGHCLYSTADDYTRLQRAFLGDGTLDGVQVLRPETTADLLRDHLGDIELPVFPAADAAATAEVDLGAGVGWGLGVMVTTERADGLRHAGSGGWLGLFNTSFWVDREAGLTIGWYSQTLPFYDAQVIAAMQAFERAVYR